MKGFLVAVCCFFIGMTLSAQNWKYVDPKIGSVGVGRTFPGPCMPFGMVKPGPDCGVLPNAGWAPMPAAVTGFSQTHVSGTGGGQKYGNILIQPCLSKESSDQLRIAETISLGYYSTTFENDIRTEITTSARCAHYRFHYPSLTSHLYIDATHFLGKDSIPNLRERQQFVGAEIEIVGTNEVRGFSRVRGGWNNGDAYTVYFALQTDRPFTSECDGQTATLQFTDSLVNVKVGISYVSALQAHKNIDSIGFDGQLICLREAWEKELSKVDAEGSDVDKRMFYTALYHTMLMPVDKTSENQKWTDSPYYDDYYAIWDTYRTSSPLITLLDPQREVDIINSLLNIYRREDYLPDARSGDCNGRTQGGSNAEVVIADAFVKGMKGIDYHLALEAMLKDGEIDPGADHEKHGRGGLNEYLSLGYIPYGIDRAGNRTVEYAFNDYCIAQVAKGLGKTDIYNRYIKRSENWKNLWRGDYEYQGMRGFIMPRDANCQWLDSVPWGFRNLHPIPEQSSPTRSLSPSTLHPSPSTLLTAPDPWEGYQQPLFESGSIKAADGVTDLYWRMVKPADFDAAKKYPTVVYVYGGPHAHNVEASWHWYSRTWETYMAQKGYIVFILDNRGSEHRGRDFEQATFRQLGQIEMQDQMKGVEYLKSLPYVDADRLGVHGWSYGGFMTISLMTNYPDVFKVGVAGGPVIDWQWYEVMYGERYMDTPQQNPEGYAKTSLIPQAKNLKGKLQIIIGYNDPTCVPQHTLSFLKACVEAGTQPDLFVYPGEGHNMMGHASVHLHERITQYFEDYLK